MNASLRIAILSLSVLGLAACATMDEETTYVAPQETLTAGDRDAAYMARIERIARARGIDVVWVNPPHNPVRMVATK